MATESSFDVVSRIDRQELDNAVNQTRKEIDNRFDFKNSNTSIESHEDDISIVTADELKLRNVVDVLRGRAVKRGVDVKAFDFGPIEPAASGAVRQAIRLRAGIPKDKSKTLIDAIKALKLKVSAQYGDEQIRVTGKSKDDLQKVMAALRALDFELPLQFVNYR